MNIKNIHKKIAVFILDKTMSEEIKWDDKMEAQYEEFHLKLKNSILESSLYVDGVEIQYPKAVETLTKLVKSKPKDMTVPLHFCHVCEIDISDDLPKVE